MLYDVLVEFGIEFKDILIVKDRIKSPNGFLKLFGHWLRLMLRITGTCFSILSFRFPEKMK